MERLQIKTATIDVKLAMEQIVFKGNLFDGKEYLEDAVVIVDQELGTIQDAGRASDLDIPKNAKVFGERGQTTIIPGLIDAHVHFFGTEAFDLISWATMPQTLAVLRSVRQLSALLRSGFTAVREMGSKGGVLLSAAVREGAIDGPTVLSCVRSLGQTGGDDDPTSLPLHIAQELSYSYYGDGPWELRKAVRKCVREGADFIKVYAATGSTVESVKTKDYSIKQQLTVEELKAIVDEAHHNGIKVAAHAIGEESMSNVVEAGVDSIEHGMALTEETASEIKKKGIYYVPTLAIFLTHPMFASMINGKTEAKDPAFIRRHFSKDMELAKEYQLDTVAGTDFGGTTQQPHGKNYLEIEAISRTLGLKEALVSATSRAAKCAGLDHTGQVTKGMDADVVLVKGNPLVDVNALAPDNILSVMKKGRRFV